MISKTYKLDEKKWLEIDSIYNDFKLSYFNGVYGVLQLPYSISLLCHFKDGLIEKDEILANVEKITKYGLPGFDIKGILRDSENNLWIANMEGLFKYDGKTGIRYNTSN